VRRNQQQGLIGIAIDDRWQSMARTMLGNDVAAGKRVVPRGARGLVVTTKPLLIIVLAAGKGTRMRSSLPKVLHAIAGRSLLGHVIAAAHGVGASQLAVVVGPDMGHVGAEALSHAQDAQIFVQTQQRGTADAVRAARPAVEALGREGTIVVLFGDTPLMTTATIARACDAVQADGRDMVVVGFEAADPTGYGRLLTDTQSRLLAIREHKDASDSERAERLCNSGVMAFRSEHFLTVLDAIGSTNAKGEYYLTDAIEVGRSKGLTASVVLAPETEVLGINDRGQLAAAEAIFQARRRAEIMASGVTLIAPDTVFFSHDTVIGQDTIIEPFVMFGPGVTIGSHVKIQAFSHLVGHDAKARLGATVADRVELGPYARIRPGAVLGEGVHVGNFVEVKNSTMEAGAKANHLTYLGDTRVGAKANIGAGTITCNYDGFFKHKTDIGAGAFIGSNSALVAPVKIGDGAIIGAGSVITKDVAADALAVSRSPQDERTGWAAKFRQMMSRKKAAKS
jgi:bifunctional UDP-N-acetylglucosamine pyrophosphorylase / glucosamine-1-phosphate N-acetyltransferase